MTPKEEAKQLVDMYSAIGLQTREEGIQCASLDINTTHIAIQKFLHSIARHLTGEHANQLAKEQLDKYISIGEEIQKL
jgi:hypothetical protein